MVDPARPPNRLDAAGFVVLGAGVLVVGAEVAFPPNLKRLGKGAAGEAGAVEVLGALVVGAPLNKLDGVGVVVVEDPAGFRPLNRLDAPEAGAVFGAPPKRLDPAAGAAIVD